VEDGCIEEQQVSAASRYGESASQRKNSILTQAQRPSFDLRRMWHAGRGFCQSNSQSSLFAYSLLIFISLYLYVYIIHARLAPHPGDVNRYLRGPICSGKNAQGSYEWRRLQ
jgi:hypothetical protein